MQLDRLKRREFITLLGGAAAWPLAARAQQPAMPVVGYLGSGSATASASFVTAFRLGLGDIGWAEGRNLAIEFRWAEDQYDRLPGLAADLVSRGVTAIVAVGSPLPTRAAKAATATIPIVFVYGGDPVEDGLVAGFNRPGGNVTGVTFITAALAPKRLELLRELVPGTDLIGVLANPTSPLAEVQWKDLQAAARPIGQHLLRVNASKDADFEAAFTSLAQQRAGALLVTTDNLFFSGRARLGALAAGHKIPWTGTVREYALAGALVSYGARFADTHRQAGVYTGRILKGEKPADLPVQMPTKFELVINLKAAKALGLEVPPTLLARADEVIE
jgi:putative ABC transport system substrate-binding protein